MDGQSFDISRFTFRLLANTGSAGATLAILPVINGEDALNDPFMYPATGSYGQTFTHLAPELHGYDAYTLKLYVAFALLNLTGLDPSPPPPVQEISR